MKTKYSFTELTLCSQTLTSNNECESIKYTTRCSLYHINVLMAPMRYPIGFVSTILRGLGVGSVGGKSPYRFQHITNYTMYPMFQTAFLQTTSFFIRIIFHQIWSPNSVKSDARTYKSINWQKVFSKMSSVINVPFCSRPDVWNVSEQGHHQTVLYSNISSVSLVDLWIMWVLSWYIISRIHILK